LLVGFYQFYQGLIMRGAKCVSANPVISVILPTYNRERVLPQAIESVLAQTFNKFELLIVNDGSTDNTRSVIAQYADKRIVYLEQENKGLALARNLGLGKARGKYVTYLDDDDLYYSDHLKTLLAVIRKRPRIGMVYGNVHFNINKKVFTPYPFTFSKDRLELDNFIPPVALIMKKSCLKKTGFFDENLIEVMEDWDMWLRVSDDYRVLHVDKYVAQVRFHQDNKTLVSEAFFA